MPDSKFARPAVETPAEPAKPAPRESFRNERSGRSERPERSDRPERADRDDFGPPPGYQPIILPGESISKYQRLAQSRPASSRGDSGSAAAAQRAEAAPEVGKSFPGDEPLFAEVQTQQAEPEAHLEAVESSVQIGSSEWEEEQKRQHQRNVAAVFGDMDEEAEPQEFVASIPQIHEQATAMLPAGRWKKKKSTKKKRTWRTTSKIWKKTRL